MVKNTEYFFLWHPTEQDETRERLASVQTEKQRNFAKFKKIRNPSLNQNSTLLNIYV